MRSSFPAVLSSDFPLFQLLTVFSSSLVCAALQPLHSSFFITSLRPPIRKVGKSGLLKRLYAPALEICNASASCFASITSGMASNGSMLKNLLSRIDGSSHHFGDCCRLCVCLLVQIFLILRCHIVLIGVCDFGNPLVNCAGGLVANLVRDLLLCVARHP